MEMGGAVVGLVGVQSKIQQTLSDTLGYELSQKHQQRKCMYFKNHLHTIQLPRICDPITYNKQGAPIG